MVYPSAPGRPTFSDVLPTSITLSWTAADVHSHKLLYYRINQYHTSDTSGNADVFYKTTTLSKNITGLTPGSTYWFIVRAVSDATDNNGFGDWSPVNHAVMPTGVSIRHLNPLFVHNDPWVTAIPYVRDGGVWKPVCPFVRRSGKWITTH